MAAGDSLAIFTMLHSEPPAADAAPIVKRGSHNVRAFSGTVNQTTLFSHLMLQKYSGGGLAVRLHWTSDEDGAGADIDWDGSFERMDATNDVDGDSFGAVQHADGNASPTDSGKMSIIIIPFTSGQIDGIVAGDAYRLKITRDGVSDTSNLLSQLHRVEIRET